MLSHVLLSLLCATAPSPGGPTPARIAPVEVDAAPAVELFRPAVGTRHTMVLFDEAGHLRPEALTDLRSFLTDRRAHVDHPIHWRLATLLVAISAHFPGRRLEVVSGYRHHNRYHPQSRHGRGRAIDLRVEGIPNRRLFDLLRASFTGIGVGYYPNSTFIHLDVRDRATIWVDYSGPGHPPCYSKTPQADLRGGVAERLGEDAARARGCKD